MEAVYCIGNMSIHIIQVPDKPHEKIYGREDAEAFVKAHFREQINMLQDMVHYGTNLVPRCFSSSNKEIQDTIICAGLLKHVVGMLDGITVLLRQGAVFPSELLLRSLFEGRLAIQWMLAKDTRTRALQYHVWHQREQLTWTRVAIKGTDESKILDNAFKSDMKGQFAPMWVEREKMAREQEKKIMALLNCPDLKPVNDEFDQLRKGKKHDVNWYTAFNGPKSIKKMCDELNLPGDYNIFYSSASGVAHATTLLDMVTPKGDDIIFEQIRSLEGMHQIISYTVSQTITTYQMLLGHYRFSELEAFFRKYLRDWRKPYMNITRVVNEGGDTTFI